MGARVFVSSTCYDLIDLRAEVEAALKEMGLTPSMSDRLSSEFAISLDANSIESCLVNVRSCDLFLIILSQRYGPSLAKAGYANTSATHLEYREAKRAGKPIYMYVRDRLEADFQVWKKNRDTKPRLSWIKDGDEGIFQLLDEHRQLQAEATTTNWYWAFQDSLQLKDRLRIDLAKPAGEARVQSLVADGRIALLLPKISALNLHCIPKPGLYENQTLPPSIEVCFTIENLGGAVAIDPVCSVFLYDEQEIGCKQFHSIATGGSDGELVGFAFNDHFDPAGSKCIFDSEKVGLSLRTQYTTPEGLVVADVSKCFFDCRPPLVQPDRPLRRKTVSFVPPRLPQTPTVPGTRFAQEWTLQPTLSYIGKTFVRSGTIVL